MRDHLCIKNTCVKRISDMNYMIIKFNTSYGSSNVGDYIINESVDKEIFNRERLGGGKYE